MAKAKKLPSGAWRVQAQITVNGVVLRKSFTDENRRKAEMAALAWQSGIQRDEIENISLRSAYERFLQAKNNVLSPSTIIGYTNLMRNSLQDIMDFKICKLTNEAVQRSINIYSATHSPKSVRNCYGLLSAVLNMFAPGFNLTVKLPQKIKVSLYIPTDDIIKSVLDAAKGSELEIPILLGAIGTLRRGEICALQDYDVYDTGVHVNKSMVKDIEGNWGIKPPKTFSSDRYVELPPFLVKQLRSIKGRIVDMTPQKLSTAFTQLLKDNNIPLFRFHDLRHYSVSILHAMGIPDKYIMAQGGWATNYTMQNVYNHILEDKQSKFAKQISDHFEQVYTVENHLLK